MVKQNCKTSAGLDVALNNGEFCGFDQSTDSKCLVSNALVTGEKPK